MPFLSSQYVSYTLIRSFNPTSVRPSEMFFHTSTHLADTSGTFHNDNNPSANDTQQPFRNSVDSTSFSPSRPCDRSNHPPSNHARKPVKNAAIDKVRHQFNSRSPVYNLPAGTYWRDRLAKKLDPNTRVSNQNDNCQDFAFTSRIVKQDNPHDNFFRSAPILNKLHHSIHHAASSPKVQRRNRSSFNDDPCSEFDQPPIVDYRSKPTWRDRLTSKVETQQQQMVKSSKPKQTFSKQGKVRSKVAQWHKPNQFITLPTSNAYLPNNEPGALQLRTKPNNEDDHQPNSSNDKPSKRFDDSYLLVEHIDRLIKKNMLDQCLMDIRNSPFAYSQPQVWNRVLHYYANKGHFNLTYRLFQEMKKRAVVPDSHSWHHLFSALASSKSPNGSKLRYATRLFDIVQPDTMSTHILNAYLKTLIKVCEYNLIQDVLKSNELPVDCVSLTLVLNALIHAQNPDKHLETLNTVISRIADTGLDNDLLSALCGASSKISSANCALPIHFISQLVPKLDLNLPILNDVPKLCPDNPILPLSTKTANWLLMMAHKIDRQRYDPSNVQMDHPLLVEHMYSQFQASGEVTELDDMSMDVLFSGMAQLGRARALVQMYFNAYFPELKPLQLQSAGLEVKLPIRGPDPSRKSFVSLFHASRLVVPDLLRVAEPRLPTSRNQSNHLEPDSGFIKAGETDQSNPAKGLECSTNPLPENRLSVIPESNPKKPVDQAVSYLQHLLMHYESVSQSGPQMKYVSNPELIALARLGASMTRPLATQPYGVRARPNTRLDLPTIHKVTYRLLSVLGILPNSQQTRKFENEPGLVVQQCIDILEFAWLHKVPFLHKWTNETDAMYRNQIRDMRRCLSADTATRATA